MDKIENLISITEVPTGSYINKGEFKIITKDGKRKYSNRNKCLMLGHSKQAVL